MEKILTEPEMQNEAQRFVEELSQREDATVVALSGDLGAGKTTFVKGIANTLGVTEHVTSPTFVIMKIYDLEHQKFERLIHIDAYRLKGEKHLEILGWEEKLRDPKNLILVEWPEKIQERIPRDVISIRFEYSGDEARAIIYG